MRDTIDMAREAGAELAELPMMDAFVFSVDDKHWNSKELERFVALVRADEREIEREACAKVCEEFARKWWKIHCDSNLHYSSTLKAHQDFCALQAAIRARGNT